MPKQSEMLATFRGEINVTEHISRFANACGIVPLRFAPCSKVLMLLCAITIVVQETAACTSRDPECWWKVKSEFTDRATMFLKDKRTGPDFLPLDLKATFYGIICQDNKHVCTDLAGLQLNLNMSPQRFQCDHLLVMKLDPSGQNLLDTVPPELTILENVRVLKLQKQSFFGPFPEYSNASKILSFDLSHSNSTGSIPGPLGTLCELRTFDISYTAFLQYNPLGQLYVYSYILPGAFHFGDSCYVQDQNLTSENPCHAKPYLGGLGSLWVVACVSGAVMACLLLSLCGAYQACNYSRRRARTRINPTESES